jgi:hypothetical protein
VVAAVRRSPHRSGGQFYALYSADEAPLGLCCLLIEDHPTFPGHAEILDMGFMASRLRSLGIDYMAVTDHRLYQPSLDLIELFTQTPIDMKIFPGEEVHVDAMEVHVVSFGGKYCVSALADDTHKFESEMKKIEEQLAGFRSDNERRIYAGFLWTYRKIKEAGGLSVMAHPHWEWCYHYVMPESILERQKKDMVFGAYELTSSLSYDSNALQVARYHQECAAGKKIPIVGVTDAHSSENKMRCSHPVVFATSSSLEAIMRASRIFIWWRWRLFRTCLEGHTGRTGW